MAYHVPPPTLPPSYTSSTTSMQSDLEGHDSHSEESSQPPASTHKRRPSVKMPGVLKRAMSSPNVRSLGSADSTGLPGDKKRNKLGYHRTAVACGKCGLFSQVTNANLVQDIAVEGRLGASQHMKIPMEDVRIAFG